MQVYIQVYNGTEMIPTNLYTFVDKLPLSTHLHQHMKAFELRLKLYKPFYLIIDNWWPINIKVSWKSY